MKILIIMISLLIVGCSNLNSLKKEHIKTYYSNGKIKSDISVSNDSKNGPVVTYFENGSIATKGYFINNEREKTWNFYDEKSGKLIVIENYKDGMLEGEQRYYYPNGVLKLKGEYKNNQRIGFWEMYDELGRLEVQNIFLNGENVINVALFQDNGNILCSGGTIDGYREGVWKYFDRDGKLLYEVEYKKGIRDGEWKAYDEAGRLIASGYYNNGVLLGLDV